MRTEEWNSLVSFQTSPPLPKLQSCSTPPSYIQRYTQPPVPARHTRALVMRAYRHPACKICLLLDMSISISQLFYRLG